MENNNNQKIGQEQFYDMLVSRELSWQAIIYDLIKTEQLDPWGIDLAILSQKYIERIRDLQELEESTFFISSKVLLAAALLLRIKSEVLHNNLKSIDEILFEKKDKKDEVVGPSQIIDFVPDEMPDIMPRTPLPRGRKVTLHELMKALDKAINTEHRRIKKELKFRRARYDIDFVLPKKKVDIKKKIKDIYKKIKDLFFGKKVERLTYTMLAGTKRDERIACFLPVLYLDSQEKIILEQERPFEEIDIWLKKNGSQNNIS
ncbi:MAG: segregation/condensation protein A [Candidatus Pacearchaeota archaeon]|nr:MAG: segregation/condensation protein A [Candidatus Pacearchaeota archaeon]